MPSPAAKSGIYKITCTSNEKSYIGSSLDIINRWSKHRSYLRKRKHHCSHLQRTWDKYGEDSFTWEIVEIVDPAIPYKERRSLLVTKEKVYLAELFSSGKQLNVSSDAYGLIYLGEDSPRAKLTEEQVLWIKDNANSRAISKTAMAKHLGMSKASITDIVRGRTWAHVGEKVSGLMTEDKAIAIYGMRNKGMSLREVGELNGVSLSVVHGIWSGRTWNSATGAPAYGRKPKTVVA